VPTAAIFRTRPPKRRQSVELIFSAGLSCGIDVLAGWRRPERPRAAADLRFGAGVSRAAEVVAVVAATGARRRLGWLLLTGVGRLPSPGRTPPPPGPPPEPPVILIVTRRRTYVVENSFALYRLSDGLPLPALSASIGANADSWCWSLNSSLATAAAADWVAPTGDGPVEVRLMINGTEWDCLIEDPEMSESWDDSSGSIRGRSLSAYLDEPYLAASAWTNVSARTAAQLAGDVLLPGDVPVDFSLEDWLVDAGAWSFQGTPVRALARIAAAGGGVLSSAKTGVGFVIAPRYPLPPWQWADATPYAVIPRNYFVSRGRRWINRPPYNLAIVSGETSGVIGRIKRYGTAGDWPAPHVIDPLITRGAAARQRGTAILADTGRQALETIAMPVGDTLGLVPNGALLELQDGVTWRGLVRSVSVSARLVGDALDVEQILEVERHYA
jgi:hypothetical protein